MDSSPEQDTVPNVGQHHNLDMRQDMDYETGEDMGYGIKEDDSFKGVASSETFSGYEMIMRKMGERERECVCVCMARSLKNSTNNESEKQHS